MRSGKLYISLCGRMTVRMISIPVERKEV